MLKELKVQIGLAFPAFLAQIAMVSMGFVDMVMTGKVGPVDMAGVALAGSIWMPLVLFTQGILLSILPNISRYRGSGQLTEIPGLVRQGLWLALALSLPLMLVVYILSFLLEQMGIEARMATISAEYLRVILWGSPAFLCFVALRCSLEGLSLMRPAMIAGFLGLLINIPSNYVLIFGKYGFPAMGGVGTGVATAMVYWVIFGTVLFYASRHELLKQGIWTFAKPHWPTLRFLVRIGFPGAVAILIEVSMFAVVAILIAPLGAIMVAGHQVALNFSSLLFMVPLSIGMAATIRTGYTLGKGDPQAVYTASRAAFSLACGCSVFIALGTITFKENIALIYNNDPVVVALAASLLVYMAIYQLTDACQIIAVSILRGYNDTKAIFIITFVCYWAVALPCGYLLGLTNFFGPAKGPSGFWLAFIIGISLGAILMTWRVLVLEKRLKLGLLGKCLKQPQMT